MPIERIPGEDFNYALLSHDKHGHERSENGELLSARLRAEVSAGIYTDVFILSHGWKGDIPAAREQYNAWIRCMLGCTPDLERIRSIIPEFRPLVIGYHWPSLPWGDEELAAEDIGPGEIPSEEAYVAAYSDRVADSSVAESALRTIIRAAAQAEIPNVLPLEVAAAYKILDREAHLDKIGEGAPPGDDRFRFDPQFLYGARNGLKGAFWNARSAVLFPLRQMSFWSMKRRARQVGIVASERLLASLQDAASDKGVRFHLMGHSFGSVVISSMLTGSLNVRPVTSAALVQGALSLWSLCSDIPKKPGTAGYFEKIARTGLVDTLITTQSMCDTAVCRLYPIAAGVARQVEYGPGEFPLYGAVGEFGFRGPGFDSVDLRLKDSSAYYGFSEGGIYNLDASDIIREGGGLSGAHNDIVKTELAHAFWECAFPYPRR